MIRRFNKKVQQSGVLGVARRKKYFEKSFRGEKTHQPPTPFYERRPGDVRTHNHLLQRTAVLALQCSRCLSSAVAEQAVRRIYFEQRRPRMAGRPPPPYFGRPSRGHRDRVFVASSAEIQTCPPHFVAHAKPANKRMQQTARVGVLRAHGVPPGAALSLTAALGASSPPTVSSASASFCRRSQYHAGTPLSRLMSAKIPSCPFTFPAVVLTM